MIIQFPNRKPTPAPVAPPKTKLTGLYILIAFSVLYLTSIWLTQYFGNRLSSNTKSYGRFSVAQPAASATPTATPIHHQVYGRFGVVEAS